jgi:hypothetical protein
MNPNQNVNLNDLKNVQNQIISNLKDPLFKILLENSHLTKIQAETFLIDFFMVRVYGKKATLQEKASLRVSKNVSKGSFNRTLLQGKLNVLKSVWTVMLLGYLGVLQTPSLSPYVEAANRLENYMKEYYSRLKSINNDSNLEERKKINVDVKNNIKNVLISTFQELVQ